MSIASPITEPTPGVTRYIRLGPDALTYDGLAEEFLITFKAPPEQVTPVKFIVPFTDTMVQLGPGQGLSILYIETTVDTTPTWWSEVSVKVIGHASPIAPAVVAGLVLLATGALAVLFFTATLLVKSIRQTTWESQGWQKTVAACLGLPPEEAAECLSQALAVRQKEEEKKGGWGFKEIAFALGGLLVAGIVVSNLTRR